MKLVRGMVLPVLAAALLLGGCVYLAPANESQNGTQWNFSNNSFLLSVSFPAGSNEQNVSRFMSVGSCVYLSVCLSDLVNYSCSWFDAVGALACPNVPRSCFINSVNGVDGQSGGFGSYWTVLINGRVSPVGISCIVPEANDKYELQVTSKSLS